MRIFFVIPIMFLLGGCSLLEPMPKGSQPSQIQMSLSGMLQSYRLPPESIPPFTHNDLQVNAAIQSMQKVASAQSLIFDGSRAAEGTVVVGRMGGNDQMVLAIAVYSQAGRVAMQDVHDWKTADNSQGFQMRERFLNTLRQPPRQ